ncbi:MAG: alcohol dehydrogenase catalytic domain-containing protein [Acidobacteria bacterium]|nr:alcohol dehydrogenase catalytic domain-containing protein [Acidobacteriota bacterium]
MKDQTMQAVVLRSPKKLELIEAPIPVLRTEDEVLIQVKACGICGSDLRYWAGENPWALHTLGRHVDNPPNLILGHEFAGIVAAVNSKRYEPLLGKRVGVQAFRVCGRCGFCRSGRENLCRATTHIGHAQGWGNMDLYPGAYAEFCPAWGDLVFPLPDHVSFQEAAMGDIYCVAVHVVGRGSPAAGGSVLCIGGGPVGLCVAQVAKARGAGRVFVSEISPLARSIVEQFDIIAIDPTSEDVRDVISRHTGRATVGCIYDTVGTAETVAEALMMLEESGTYVNVAVHSARVDINMATLGSERTVTSSSNALYSDVREAYELIFSGRVNPAPMITHCLPLKQYQQGFDLLLQVPKQAYKVVFLPDRESRNDTGRSNGSRG